MLCLSSCVCPGFWLQFWDCTQKAEEQARQARVKGPTLQKKVCDMCSYG